MDLQRKGSSPPPRPRMVVSETARVSREEKSLDLINGTEEEEATREICSFPPREDRLF